jgi:hypothetical protein
MKGLSLLNYLRVFEAQFGPSCRDELLSRLPGSLRDMLSDGEVVANGWYPVSWKCALHQAALDLHGDMGLARHMGYEMTKRDLSGIYALLVRVAVSPEDVLPLSARILGRYLRPVKLAVEEIKPQSVRFAFTDGAGFTRELWEDLVGGCQASLEIAGARHVHVRIQAGGQTGDQHARCVARWNEGAKLEMAKP